MEPLLKKAKKNEEKVKEVKKSPEVRETRVKRASKEASDQ